MESVFYPALVCKWNIKPLILIHNYIQVKNNKFYKYRYYISIVYWNYKITKIQYIIWLLKVLSLYRYRSCDKQVGN